MGRDKISFPDLEDQDTDDADGDDFEQEEADAGKKQQKRVNLFEQNDDDEDFDEELDDDGDDDGDEDEHISPTEQQARDRNWLPKEEWVAAGKDPEDWVDAKTFIKNGELMDVISKQNKRMKNLEKVIEEFKGYTDKVRAQAIKDTKAKLLAERHEAMESQDFDRAVEIDDEIKAVESTATSDTDATDDKDNPIKAYFEDVWVGKNQWYNTNRAMRATADVLGTEFVQKNPSADAEEVFEYVDKYIRKEFPDHFQRRKSAGAVESGKGKAGSKGKGAGTAARAVKDRLANLSKDERRVGKRFVEQGLFKNLEEYAADLVKYNV